MIAKLPGNLETVYLGEQNLHESTVLSKFSNVMALYLPNNQLSELNSIQTIRIKILELSNNSFTSLEPLKKFTHLEELYLDHNSISNLDLSLRFLKRFPQLKVLSLRYNPLNSEPNYRQKIIDNLPNLEILDMTPVNTVSTKTSNTFDLKPRNLSLTEKTLRNEAIQAARNIQQRKDDTLQATINRHKTKIPNENKIENMKLPIPEKNNYLKKAQEKYGINKSSEQNEVENQENVTGHFFKLNSTKQINVKNL
eukprot:TRINITY_DN3309_c0_g2_i1.p2 TRINITY_DN3309_c0_g2~~TRINITY_DN3309_c0_g2_i1.p2  ORF type:complete len:253 (+),score=60.66 TRINITY_DN3309_c0_g2_i1:1244-2002(+)